MTNTRGEAAAVTGRFGVLREVGRGAAGIVFQAHDRLTGQTVALKVIGASEADAEAYAHFLEEGELLSQIDHPNIVRIIDFGTLGALEGGSSGAELAGRRFEPDSPYIAMEWVEGQDLAARHADRPLSLPEALECARQVASALAAAHQKGIIHRDIKPSNVLVLETPPASTAMPARRARVHVKLVDFGVACDAQTMMAPGPMVGTPAYMAPEQARGDTSLDPRCDVYSLGATLFEVIAGRPPHVGPTPIATLAKVVSTPAPRLCELVADIPDALDELCAEMLALEFAARPTAREVCDRLGKLLDDPDLPSLASAVEGSDSIHSSVSRLVTTLVALHAVAGSHREDEIQKMSERGAEAVRLGKDSIVAFLGARRAHGGEAALAIELGRRLAGMGARVGVATGRALVDLARPAGEVVDKASALAREASSGQLFADEITAELARTAYEFAPGPGSVWTVGADVPERRRKTDQTPFVGRGVELETLFRAFERAVDEKRPLVASVSGPPGIGKSRLMRELVRRLEEYERISVAPITEPSVGMSGGVPALLGDPTVRIVQARCEAYGRARALGTAADTLIDLLRLAKGCSQGDANAALAPLRLTHDEGGLLGRFLSGEPFDAGVDPHRARDILYLAMTELVLKVVEGEPTVIVLEDLQWSDPESVAWFEHLLSRAVGQALLLCILARPSFWKDYPERFKSRDHVRIELRPIPRRATMEIARAVIGCDPDDPKLDQVARQSAGSPLFAEELARVLAAGKPLAAVPTLEAAIQVSLDALEARSHEAVAHMSVFGLAAWDQGLRATGIEDPLAPVTKLVEAELVVERESARFPGTREFWFKHALVRDVAYHSLSDAMRADLHGLVGSWLAEVGEDAATIAQHYDLGGRSALAAGYWEQAARRALAANALTDAVRMADRALTFAESERDAFSRATLLDEIYSRLDERAAERADAIEAMAQNAYDEACEVRTMGARARYDHARSAGEDVEGRLLEVVRRSAELCMVDEQARSLATLAQRSAFAGDLAKAEGEAAQLLELAESGAVQAAAVDAWQALAVVRQTRGELAAALEARRNAARAAKSAGLKQREAMLTMNLGFALTTIGAAAEARREIEAGIRMAEEIGSAGTVRLGRMILLGWAAHFGADPSLDAALAEPRSSADEAAMGGWIVKDRVTLGVLFYRGCELLQGGDRASLGRARSLLSTSAEAYRATDNRDVLPVALGYWAEAERRLGQTEQAVRIAREAADLVEAGAPSLLNEAVIYLALHGALVDMGDLVGAHQAVERGIAPLLRRLRGLHETPYEKEFLALSHNASLIDAADAHACLPRELERLIG
jgi:serine/threonine protein kinase/tetratricopeptide (TPR) repeat protein